MESAATKDKTVAREGYLSKRGHVMPNWKMRYFVLKAEGGTCTLQYYKSAQLEGGPQGSIDLRGATLDAPRYDDPKTKWFSFSVQEAKIGTKAGTIYPLRCLSLEDKTAWAAALSVDIKIASNSTAAQSTISSGNPASSKGIPDEDKKAAAASPRKTNASDEKPPESPQGTKPSSGSNNNGSEKNKLRKGQPARHIVRPKESDASVVRPGARTAEASNPSGVRRAGRSPDPSTSHRQRGHSPPKPKNCLIPEPSCTASPLPPPPPHSKPHPATQPQAQGHASPPPQLPLGWAQASTPEKKTYYYHAATGTTSWERPNDNTPVPSMPSTTSQPTSAATAADASATPTPTEPAEEEAETTAKASAEQSVRKWLGTRDLASLLTDLSAIHPKCCPTPINLPAKPSAVEVKKAYRAAARALHPDKARAGAVVSAAAAIPPGGKDGGAGGTGTGDENTDGAVSSLQLTEDDAVLAEVLFTALAGLYAAFERKVQRAAEMGGS